MSDGEQLLLRSKALKEEKKSEIEFGIRNSEFGICSQA
jgi:hypothetical protein